MNWKIANNDSIIELRNEEEWPTDSVGAIVTSIPFGNQYEYSGKGNDLGYNEDNGAFWKQMDHLTPNLKRVLRPGRMACIHVKDRIRFGNVTGLGFPTVEPFSDECVSHFKSHGFHFVGRITIDTDVVRENSGTYRLGYTRMMEDGTVMGCGMPEYVLLFRKEQSDTAQGWADQRVCKGKMCRVCGGPLTEVEKGDGDDDGDEQDDEEEGGDDEGERSRVIRELGRLPSMAPFSREAKKKEEPEPVKKTHWKCLNEGHGEKVNGNYTLSQWQIDAAGIYKSSGNRLLEPQMVAGMSHEDVRALWKRQCVEGGIYDLKEHEKLCQEMLNKGKLPTSHTLFSPFSGNSHVWDTARMLTLNSRQSQKRKEKHVCPLQLDVVERLIRRFTTPGEVVLDPFLGIGTVVYQALLMERKGWGIELNDDYAATAVGYAESAELTAYSPTLFDLAEFTAKKAA